MRVVLGLQDEQPFATFLAMSAGTKKPTGWPHSTAAQWGDWTWQLANQLTRVEDLAARLDLSQQEVDACKAASQSFRMAITPYYFSLIDPRDSDDPIRRQAVPCIEETHADSFERVDPLAEEAQSATPYLTHRYPNRVLLYSTPTCAVYCRHCFRKRKVGDPQSAMKRDAFEEAVVAIEADPAIHDVLVSGGDCLTLPDTRLDSMLTRLRKIEHVEIIRLATRCPVTLPQRITPALIEVLKKHQPIFVATQFNHLRECTEEAATGLARLADGGSVVVNQMVLLRGVNDDATMVQAMNRWLLRHRCRPYYIFQCDPAPGTSHLRTPIETGIQMIDKLRGWSSGLAVPHFAVDLPGGGGKVTVQPDYVVGRKGRTWTFRNYRGDVYQYEDPDP